MSGPAPRPADTRREGVAHSRHRHVEHPRCRATRDPGDPRDRRAERCPRLGSARHRLGVGPVRALRVGARGDLGRLTDRGGRSHRRPRSSHEVVPVPPRTDDQPAPLADRRPQLRVLLRGPAALGQDRCGVRPRRAVRGSGGYAEALRRQRSRVRTGEHELRRRRAVASRAVLPPVRDGGHRGRRARNHDRLQPAQWPLLQRGR